MDVAEDVLSLTAVSHKFQNTSVTSLTGSILTKQYGQAFIKLK